METYASVRVVRFAQPDIAPTWRICVNRCSDAAKLRRNVLAEALLVDGLLRGEERLRVPEARSSRNSHQFQRLVIDWE